MALRAYPTIPSDLTQEQVFKSDTIILHTTSSDTNLKLQYWITTRSILLTFAQDRREPGFTAIYFNPFSSKSAWTRLYPEYLISNTISVQLNETNLRTFLSLASSMSISPTPATPPTHSSLSNQTVEPTTALIALMNQYLQQNAAIMAQLHSRPSPPPALQLLQLYQYKSHLPPFPK